MAAISAADRLRPSRRKLANFDVRQHVGGLLRPHDRNLALRPHEQKTRVKRPARHAVITGAERTITDHGDFRHFRSGDRHDHLGAVFGDAAVFVLPADHVAGDVLKEDHRHAALIAKLHEVRALERAVVEQHAVVAKDADLETPEVRETADERAAVGRLVFVETAAIDDARNHFADVELHFDVARDDSVELVGIVIGLLRRNALDVAVSSGSPSGQQFARDGNRLLLAGRGIVGGAGNPRMHIGAAQVFNRHVLAGRRFHQRRTAEEDCAGAPHDDVVLAQCRHVGAARRAVTEYDRDLRDAQFGKDRLIAENAPGQIPVGEDSA